jgi:hypothetical protein
MRPAGRSSPGAFPETYCRRGKPTNHAPSHRVPGPTASRLRQAPTLELLSPDRRSNLHRRPSSSASPHSFVKPGTPPSQGLAQPGWLATAAWEAPRDGHRQARKHRFNSYISREMLVPPLFVLFRFFLYSIQYNSVRRDIGSTGCHFVDEQGAGQGKYMEK